MKNSRFGAIQQADEEQLNEIEQAVIQRYEALFPEWEMISLSLPKNDLKERNRILEWTIQILRK